jgi:tetratricopeptide (TPR) repeat protein
VSGSLFDQYKAALRRGHVAALAGDLEQALEAYAVAADLVPERALPIASQGTVLHRLDRWPDASAAFELALRMAPDDEATLRARAQARDERGLRSGAAADYERLAFVLDVAGRSAEAAQAARRAADLEPSATRDALAGRLAQAAAHAAERMPPPQAPSAGPGSSPDAPMELDGNGSTALELYRDLEVEGEATADPQAEAEAEGEPWLEPAVTAGPEAALAVEAGAEPEAADEPEAPTPPARMDPASAALAARIAELGTQPMWVDMSDREIGVAHTEGGSWPPVDLPSPPPPPIEGPPPDPEELLAEAAGLIAAGDVATARDKMLIAVMVHREAGRLDAALEICLQLLTTAPGDPQVHLAIANLQLDRGWTALATEKIELLLRLTSLTGDTQAEADVHGLASERLRDDAMSVSRAR